jgi:hypothetical protein
LRLPSGTSPIARRMEEVHGHVRLRIRVIDLSWFVKGWSTCARLSSELMSPYERIRSRSPRVFLCQSLRIMTSRLRHLHQHPPPDEVRNRRAVPGTGVDDGPASPDVADRIPKRTRNERVKVAVKSNRSINPPSSEHCAIVGWLECRQGLPHLNAKESESESARCRANLTA